MKTLTIKIIFALASISILFNGCKKTETGPAGKDGNSNVKATLYDATSWSWSTPYYYLNLNVPDLTATNINAAAVMVYFNKGTSNSWIALPYTQYDSPYDYFMGFNTSSGNVQITWVYDSSLSSGSNPNVYYATTVKFKVVVIPPAIIKQYPNINLNNYNEVMKTFNIKENESK